MFRIRRPLCWMAVFYALGLACAPAISREISLCGLCVTVGVSLIRLRKGAVSTFLVLAMAFFCVGALRMNQELHTTYTGNSEPTAMTARVIDCVSRDDEKGYATLTIDRICMDGEAIFPSGDKVRLYISVEAQQTIPVGGRIEAQRVKFSALRERRNPGGFDQQGYYRSRGVVMTASAGDAWTITPSEGISPYALMYALRCTVSAQMERLFTYASPMFHGLLLGVKDGLDESLYAQLRVCGLAHLLAVSGLHVSAVLYFALRVMDRWQISLRWSTAWLLAILWGFALITGGAASTLRACLMGSVLIVARATHERYDAPAALAAAFLLLTILNPWQIRDRGFVLSFATVSGILIIHPPLERWLDARMDKHPHLAQMISASLSAQIASFPFQMLFFGEVSLIGLFMNLIGVPLATALLVGGMLLLVLSAVCMPAAQLFAPSLRVGALALQGIVQAASNIPFASVRIAAPPIGAIAAYYALLLGVSPLVHGRRKTVCIALCVAVIAVLLGMDASKPIVTRYVTLDVGQGDCAVLHTREGAVCVIDTGPEGSSELTGYLHHEGLDVDMLILSHLDSDHAGGIEALGHAGIPVERIVMPYGMDEQTVSPQVMDGLNELVRRGSQIVGAQRGDAFSLPGVEMRVVGPYNGEDESNEQSLVTRLETQGVTILTTGDTTEDVEPVRGTECEILKVAHHGSKYSTSDLFLDYAQPETAIISVGRNAFGHPSQEVLGRLAARGVHVLRTDECGAITVTIEDGAYRIATMVNTGE